MLYKLHLKTLVSNYQFVYLRFYCIYIELKYHKIKSRDDILQLSPKSDK